MKLYQVDAFTRDIFKGNPAGVCIVDDIADDRLFQNMAMEMNLAETAFLKKEQGNEYRLRWFTPEVEIEFCGHATLASAHILWEKGIEKQETELCFHTMAGELVARHKGNRIELDFPLRRVQEVEPNKLMLQALKIEPVFTGSDGKRTLVEVQDAVILEALSPDFNLLKKSGSSAYMLTCRSDLPEYDFISRFFAPAVGINEDPVTGSAHSYLAPYWAEKLGKKILTGYQASRRGGIIECEIAENERVLLRGQAVTVFEIQTTFSNVSA